MTYSQSQQDLFVHKIFGENYSGFFLDIGAGYNFEEDKKINSNSLFLEQCGWKGIAIDIDLNRLQNRTCMVHAEKIGDVRSISDILKQLNCPKLIDYISIDIDGDDFKVLKNIIENNYEFKILTYEHDLYSGKDSSFFSKNAAFSLLNKKGYTKIMDNVCANKTLKDINTGYPYEDWYINSKYISENYAKSLFL